MVALQAKQLGRWELQVGVKTCCRMQRPDCQMSMAKRCKSPGLTKGCGVAVACHLHETDIPGVAHAVLSCCVKQK